MDCSPGAGNPWWTAAQPIEQVFAEGCFVGYHFRFLTGSHETKSVSPSGPVYDARIGAALLDLSVCACHGVSADPFQFVLPPDDARLWEKVPQLGEHFCRGLQGEQ